MFATGEADAAAARLVPGECRIAHVRNLERRRGRIGNAVPVLFAKGIANAMANAMKGGEK